MGFEIQCVFNVQQGEPAISLTPTREGPKIKQKVKQLHPKSLSVASTREQPNEAKSARVNQKHANKKVPECV